MNPLWEEGDPIDHQFVLHNPAFTSCADVVVGNSSSSSSAIATGAGGADTSSTTTTTTICAEVEYCAVDDATSSCRFVRACGRITTE